VREVDDVSDCIGKNRCAFHRLDMRRPDAQIFTYLTVGAEFVILERNFPTPQKGVWIKLCTIETGMSYVKDRQQTCTRTHIIINSLGENPYSPLLISSPRSWCVTGAKFLGDCMLFQKPSGRITHQTSSFLYLLTDWNKKLLCNLKNCYLKKIRWI